jgi:hypothetical protein
MWLLILNIEVFGFFSKNFVSFMVLEFEYKPPSFKQILA